MVQARTVMAAVTLMAASCARSPQRGVPDGAAGSGGALCTADAASGDGTIASVAQIVIRTCATAGCHDPIQHEHGMDLSTADLIYQSWVGKKGLDHCSNMAVFRVVPGDPDGSFVMTKIRATGVLCSLGTRMPPPPLKMLSACEIEIVRSWIAAGAPGPSGGGDAGLDDGGGARDGDDDAATDGGDDAAPDVPEQGSCTTATPCDPVTEICIEATASSTGECYTRWECYTHAPPDDDTVAHVCPADTSVFCGCDGTMFEMSSACPNRPYDHIGACDDGYSCDVNRVRCADPAPTCLEGQAAAVIAGCWGPCVPIASCRCDQNWQCPRGDLYRCSLLPDFRCLPIPPAQDAGPD